MHEGDASTSDRAPERRRGLALLLLFTMCVLSLVLWIGVPLAWMWIAGQVVPDSRSFYLWILLAIPVTMVAVGWLLYRVNRVYVRVSGESEQRRQTAWLASQASDRRSRPPRQAIEVIMAASVGIALVLFVVWFFFLAGSPLPPPS